MRLVTIVGARPQFIKAAVVSRAIANWPSDGEPAIDEVIVHTGQHYHHSMSDIFFREMHIPEPAYNLGIGDSPHGKMTGRMLSAIERVLMDEKPEAVLVYGDTNSTLAGALAAAKLHIPVGHVEAGLRSFNRRMPEEINRVVTDHVAELLFAPTDVAVNNLRKEGLSESRIHKVGDVMYDASLRFADISEKHSDILTKLKLKRAHYVLATVHRAENTDNVGRLKVIFQGLMRVAKTIPVILPLHPRTRNALESASLLRQVAQSIRLIEPIGFLDMVMLEKHAAVIATDSGGVQKEAYFYSVPCVTLRDETEWIELVQIGANRVASPVDASSVSTAVEEAWHSRKLGVPAHLYGDGNAAKWIVEILLSCYSEARPSHTTYRPAAP